MFSWSLRARASCPADSVVLQGVCLSCNVAPYCRPASSSGAHLEALLCLEDRLAVGFLEKWEDGLQHGAFLRSSSLEV